MAIEAKARQNFIENNNGGVGGLRNDRRGSCEAVRRRRVGPEVRPIPKTRVEQAHSIQVIPIKVSRKCRKIKYTSGSENIVSNT
jgi:hypothetical protein